MHQDRWEFSFETTLLLLSEELYATYLQISGAQQDRGLGLFGRVFG